METANRMAVVVDGQNDVDPSCRHMAPYFDGPALRAAHALVFKDARQPNGYTQYILQVMRRSAKGTS